MFRRKRRFGRLSSLDQELDKGVVAGVVLSVAFILFGGLLAGGGMSLMGLFGLAIVVGGTLGATLVQFPTHEVRAAWSAFQRILRIQTFAPSGRIDFLVSLGQSVRRNGLIVLDREAERTPDPFLKLALQLAVDGQPEHEIRRLLELEREAALERDLRSVNVFETMGNYAPALGLIGTLLGLIQMLGSLSDPAAVGPAMAVALTTTLYGAVFANLICYPVAGKLKHYLQQQLAIKTITTEGVISLSREENPVVLEQRLKSFLPLARAA